MKRFVWLAAVLAMAGGQVRAEVPAEGADLPYQGYMVEDDWELDCATEPPELQGMAAELLSLVSQGRRDRAASPEFLDALEALALRHAGEGGGVAAPSDRLPLKADFRGPGMPAGWRSVEPSAWQFGDGAARQVFRGRIRATTCSTSPARCGATTR